MNLRTFLIALVLVAIAAFAVVNWPAFVAPTRLSLLFTEVQAPLGLIMLALTALLTALFLAYLVFQQAGVILEARRYARELKANRELADRAEASRFTELRAFIEAELRRLDARIGAVSTGMEARIDRLEQATLARLDEATGSLSACVGEVDDKLDRALAGPGGDLR
jgi:uncharacterized integral membrane protein